MTKKKTFFFDKVISFFLEAPKSVDPATKIMTRIFFSLSGCPRAPASKKKVKLPGDEYITAKFRASDGKMNTVMMFYLDYFRHNQKRKTFTFLLLVYLPFFSILGLVPLLFGK